MPTPGDTEPAELDWSRQRRPTTCFEDLLFLLPSALEPALQERAAPVRWFHLAASSGLRGAERGGPGDSCHGNSANPTDAHPLVRLVGHGGEAPCWGQAREESSKSAYSEDVWGHLGMGGPLRPGFLPGMQSALKMAVPGMDSRKGRSDPAGAPCQPRSLFSYAKNAEARKALGR